MSDSSTFEFLVPADKLGAFGDELLSLAVSLECYDGQAEACTSAKLLIERLQALAADPKRQECLTLCFTEDGLLREFQAENPELRAGQPGKIAVGCFWLWCRLADGIYAVSLTSATRSISSLMKESASVQRACRSLGRHTTSGRVHLINEWNETSFL